MVSLLATSTHEQAFSAAHFGGNILAHRDGLGEDGTYDEAVDRLGIETIRYPGGSLTERYFDLSDPDRISAQHYSADATIGLLPFSEFMEFAEATGRAALVVLPTRTALSDTSDGNGDRFAAIDEDTLRGFIRDTLDGVYGRPEIKGFEIGNEYWDSGEMSSVEYGRVASEMATIIHDEITAHPEYETRFQDTDILVQMGMNYGHGSLDGLYDGPAGDQLAQFMADYDLKAEGDFIYANGEVAWPHLSNHLVMREFDTDAEKDAIDGVVAHVYSRGEDATASQYFALNTLDSTWGEVHPDLEIHVTEWNVRNRDRDEDEDFGLVQSREMMDVLEAMSSVDADSAYVYPVQQRSPASLAGDEDDPQEKTAGVFFSMLNETLPGLRPVVLDGAEGRETELATEHADIHAFAGGDRMAFYVFSTENEGSHVTEFDASALFTGFDTIEVEKLGVAPGDAPGSAHATPERTVVPADEILADGAFRLELGAREIMQVTLKGVAFSGDLSAWLQDDTQAVPAPAADAAIADPESLPLTDAGTPTIEAIAAAQEREATDQDDDDANPLVEFLSNLGLFPFILLGI